MVLSNLRRILATGHPLKPRYGIASLAPAFYAYVFIRELGHLVAKSMLGLPLNLKFLYGIIPSTDVTGLGTPPLTMAFLIASGPISALIAGYAIVAVLRWRMPASVLGTALGMLGYLCLVLDPIYFAIIPILHLGGEPEALIFGGGIPQRILILLALGVLVLNLIILRLKLIPILKRQFSP